MSPFEIILRDLLYCSRQLRKSPLFTTMAVLTLGLGLGCNTVLFSVMYHATIGSTPYPESNRLIWITDDFLNMHLSFVPHPTYFAWREQNHTCSEIAAFRSNQNLDLTGSGHPQRVLAADVSAEFLPLLGIKPSLGRSFSLAEDRPAGAHVVILENSLWVEHFAANPEIVGRDITLDGKLFTVIGVLPAGTKLPIPGPPPQVLTPLQLNSEVDPQSGIAYLNVLARLKPGVTSAQAEPELFSIEHRVLATYPRWFGRYTQAMKLTVAPLREILLNKVRPALLTLVMIATFVLLIACANVAHLLLVRTLARQQEFSIRAALGAEPKRLATQLFIESLILASLGGLVGLVLCLISFPVLRSLVPANLLDLRTIGIDIPSVIFSFVLLLTAGVLTGLVPILALSRIKYPLHLGTSHTTRSRPHHVISHLLMASEIGAALILVIASVLLLKTYFLIIHSKLGFNSDHLLTATISLPAVRYPDALHQSLFFKELLERVQELPTVRSAAVTTALPFSSFKGKIRLKPAGKLVADDDAAFSISTASVSPDYFKTMGISLQVGRMFTEKDNSSSTPVIIVNKTFATRFLFDAGSPLGQRLEYAGKGAKSQIMTVVGVVDDVQHTRPPESAFPEVFLPFLQNPTTTGEIVVSTQKDPKSLGPSLQREVFAVDPSQPIYDVLTMNERIASVSQGERFQTFGAAALGGLAVLLAAIGIYGVVSYTFSESRRELAIRKALGAQGWQIVEFVILSTLKTAVTGTVMGLILALFLTRYLRSSLWQVKSYDPMVLIGTSVFMIGLALIACWVPTARALRIQPERILREV